MEFNDFKNNSQELIGKTVLYESGTSYNTRNSLSLRKIEKVTKTGFRITSMPDTLFDLINGHQKGLNGRMHMVTVSKCKLLTHEEAQVLKAQWALKKETNLLKEKMRIKLETMSLEQLQKMELL